MSAPLLEAQDLVVQFRGSGGTVRAVNGVSLTVRPGETLGLVGESGCGKSTLGRAMMGLTPLSGGSLRFSGEAVESRTAWAALRRQTAMIFQDPLNSLNPRLTVGETLAEVLRVHGKVPRAGVAGRVAELLTMVGLRPEFAARRPGSLSGGQCQRVGIARALAIEPKLVIADECVAALDVSIQAQIINLLIELKERIGLALVFIAHDLALVRRLCDRVAVMYLGRIVEEGPTEQVFGRPLHPYADALIRAIPEIDPDRPLPEAILAGEPPSPLRLPAGCALHPRCPRAFADCAGGQPPPLLPVEGREVACLLYRPASVPA
ncbi:ABC transporter ATP-binding protein [Geminicoccus harenae]|uniref:ABC transporter ATP-binding protein n=1 Tax=Geminicoccus harenae TaxID=2498453 RepID=UPI001C956528|nr:ABC transporter ATP-binding protein [Geminicoccus harenae]